MYRIIDAKTGALIEEIIAPRWVKQQKRVDYPILCDFAEEADGIVLSDGETVCGIEGKGMPEYTPIVRAVEVSSDPHLFERVNALENELKKAQEENKVLQEMNQSALGEILLLQAQQMQPLKGGV